MSDIAEIREQTYQRKLEENFQLKKKFFELGQLSLKEKFSAESGIDTLHDDNDNTDIVELKKESIALYNSLKSVPFKPQRDDLIGVVLADSSIETQVRNLQESTEDMTKLIKSREDELQFVQAMNFNLQLMNNLLIAENSAKEEPTNETDNWSAEMSTADLKEVDELTNVLTAKETELISYTKDIVTNYLVEKYSTTGKSKRADGDTDVDELNEKKLQVLRLVEKLLNNLTLSPEEYVETPESLLGDPVIRQLLIGDVIEQKENLRFIRLCRFGLSE